MAALSGLFKGFTSHPALMTLLSATLWSFSGVLGKTVTWNPLTVVGLRALIAAILLGKQRGSYKLKFDRPTIVGSLGVFLTSTLFITANTMTTAANAIVLQYAMPAIVITLCAIVEKKRPKRLDVLTCVVVMLGIVLCFAESFGQGRLLGDALALLSAFTYAAVFFAARMPGADPQAYTYQGNLFSCVLLLTIPFDKSFSFDPTQWLIVVAMGLCLTGGYLFFSLGLKYGASPVAASLISNAEAVLNPTWVFLFYGENPGALAILGAIIVLAAVMLYGLQVSKTEKGYAHAKRKQSIK